MVTLLKPVYLRPSPTHSLSAPTQEPTQPCSTASPNYTLMPQVTAGRAVRGAQLGSLVEVCVAVVRLVALAAGLAWLS